MGNSGGTHKKNSEPSQPTTAGKDKHSLRSFDGGTEMSPKTSLFSKESLISKYDDKFHGRNDTNLSAHQVCSEQDLMDNMPIYKAFLRFISLLCEL